MTERERFEFQFPVPSWAEWNEITQTYDKREDHIISATALAMYRKAWQAWLASSEVVR